MVRSTLLLATLITVGLSPVARAAEIVRDAALVASMPIQGVSFDMLPRQAFERLRAAGYQAGSIDTYEAWQEEGIEFVKGTYGGAEGFSSVGFARRGERITRITESWNRPRPFDAEQLIAAAREHFLVTGETPTCRAASATSGACRIQDAEDPHEVDLVFGLQVLPGMLIRYVESKRALAP